MAILISAHKISKTFSARPLFEDLSFVIETGDRIGLIGPNGMGKSTLLKIISKKITHDSGELSFGSGIKIGILEQTPQFNEELPIFQTLTENTDPEDWDAQGLAHEYISRFQLDQFPENTPIKELSGGWKKRVALARELITQPDLLLLDEPTNHLDIEGIMWLEDFLARARFATITVTHDRLFLQRISNQIIELDKRHEGGLLKVKGDYAKYVEVREQLISGQERREVILKNTLRRETEWLKRGPKARTTKQTARIKRAYELQDTVGNLNQRNLSRKADFEFQSTGRSPKKLIEVENVSKSYGDKVIFSDLNLKISPRSRIGLLGGNGAGKSTLVKVLMGIENPTTGTVFQADKLQVSYFDQTREALDPELSVSETLCPKGSHVDYCGRPMHIRGYLDRFLFNGQQAELKVGKLSGGEQSRLMVARLMLKKANVLVLDEPTNDLDLATLTVLEECLKEFDGAVILVSHDRYFLDQVVDQLIAFPSHLDNDRQLLSFADFSQWEEWNKEKQKPSLNSKSGAKQLKQTDQSDKKSTSSKRKLSFKEQRELDSMEALIQEKEKQLETLTQSSTSKEVTQNTETLTQITQQMSLLQTEIEALYARWQELESITS